MNITIRAVEGREMLDVLFPLTQYAFQPSPPFENKMEVGKGSFTIKINDPVCPWNEGFWRLVACDGRLVISPSTYGECDLSIQGLSALVAGTHDPEDFALRGWGNPDPAIQSIQREMFPRMTPFYHEMF